MFIELCDFIEDMCSQVWWVNNAHNEVHASRVSSIVLLSVLWCQGINARLCHTYRTEKSCSELSKN